LRKYPNYPQKLTTACLHFLDISQMAETTTVHRQYLIQQTTDSIINYHLSFMMSLLHVSTSTRPSSGRLYTADSVKDVHV